MSAMKENSYNEITGAYEFQPDADDSDYQYQQYMNRVGLGIRVHINGGWMWFSGYKFGVPIVSDKVRESVKVEPNHLEQLCEQLKSEGFSISIMMRKEDI